MIQPSWNTTSRTTPVDTQVAVHCDSINGWITQSKQLGRAEHLDEGFSRAAGQCGAICTADVATRESTGCITSFYWF